MRDFVDSSDLIMDGPALGRRMERDGYLLIRQLLPREAIADLRRQCLDVVAARGWLRPDTPIESAIADRTWRGIATLDAAARMTRSLASSGALRRGSAAARFLIGLVVRATTEDLLSSSAIPPWPPPTCTSLSCAR